VWSSLARSPFAIEFSTSTEERIPQGTYRIEHAALGRFDLFLVPIGPPRESQRYQAVFG
jgi:hypothetical protein